MAEPAPPSFPLYLRPSQPKDSEQDSLGYQIREIVGQRGHLRTVTQASLAADQHEQNDIDADKDGLKDAAAETFTEPGTLEHVQGSRQKMAEYLAYVVTATRLA